MKVILNIGSIVLTLILTVAVCATISLILMVTWNAIVPVIFGLNTITYWQAVILYILSNILFKGGILAPNDIGAVMGSSDIGEDEGEMENEN